MPVRKRLVCFVAALLLATPSTVRAADEWYSLLTQDTLGFVAVRNFKASSEKLESLAAKIGQPTPNLVDFFKLTLGIEDGFDANGDVLVAIVPGEPIATIVALPVSDYKKFVSQFDGADPNADCTKIRIAGQPALVGKKKNYAVFADPGHEMTLRQFIASGNPWWGHNKFKPWMEKNDIVAVITPSGINMASQYGIEQLDKAAKEFRTREIEGPDGDAVKKQIAAMFQIYRDVLQFFPRDIESAGIGARIDEGNMHLTSRLTFSHNSRIMQSLELEKEVKDNPLALIPRSKFVFALVVGDLMGLQKVIAGWSVKMMQSQPQLYGLKELTDEQAEQLSTAMGDLETKASATVMVPAAGGEPLCAGFMWAAKVGNSDNFLEKYQQSFTLWNKLAGKEEAQEDKPFWEVEPVEIEKRKGLRIAVDVLGMMGQQVGLPAMPEMQAVLEKLFGPGGKATSFLAAVDETTILSTYMRGRLEKLLAAQGKVQESLADDPQLVKTDAMLLEKSQVRAYLSLSGAMAFLRQVADAFGGADMFPAAEFPDVPPIGFAAAVSRQEGFETDLVIPAETLEALGKYVSKVSAQFQDAIGF